MRTPVRILHLEDDPRDAELVRVALEENLQCVVHHVSNRQAFESAIHDRRPDLILCDNSLPGYSGLAALQITREKDPDIPVILLSGTLGEEQAIESLQQGAVDYILKMRMGRLIPAVKRALHEAEERSQRRQAEAALRESEQRIRYQAALLDKAQDAILVHDLNSQLIFWNKGAERIYGWRAAEAIGKSVDDLLFIDPSAALEARRAVVENGEWAGELRQVNKDGKELFVQSRWTLVPDPTGQAILVINTDISEKKTLENQFLRAQRLESIGVLAGGIAHDLNNVLVPILVVAELLRSKVTDADSLEWLDTLESSAKHGANLIKQILAFSRGMGGERVQVQLRHLIHEIQKILRETFPRSIEVNSDIPADLWLVSAVATHLSQVLMNLCVNSKDAMPDGGRIQIKCENVVFDKTYAHLQSDACEGPYVVVTVADTGTGIPAESMERIFEPFFTTKEMGKGTGLGLSTVKGIIKNHGGFVTVQSELGKGTTFKLHLPALASSTEQTPVLKRPSLLRGNGELILVVENEVDVRVVIGATLEEYGYRVLSAADGAQAFALLAQNRGAVKIVLTGLTLPDMEAATVMDVLRKAAPSLKFIVVSGTLDQERLAQIRKAGEVESLAKPFTAEQLLTLIDSILIPA